MGLDIGSTKTQQNQLRYRRLLRALKKETTETKFEKIPCVVNGFLYLLTPAEFREWTELKEEQRLTRKWDKYYWQLLLLYHLVLFPVFPSKTNVDEA